MGAIENACCGLVAQRRFMSVLDELSKRWDEARRCSQHESAIDQQLAEARGALPVMMARLRARDAQAGKEWVDRLAGIEEYLQADIAHWRAKEAGQSSAADKRSASGALDGAQSCMNSIERCLRLLREEKEYAESYAFRVLFDPFLLINGQWGTGKTHLVCDITQERLRTGHATILVLAKNFEGEVAAEVCARIAPGPCSEVFDHLQEVAATLGGRALVIVDGVNEGRRRDWRRAISELRALVSQRPDIALIVTCRTPFETVAVSPTDLMGFHEFVHRGFEDQEFDAQAEFFRYYELPLSEVPLLDQEFARPLTLKLICQSLQRLSSKKFGKGFAGIASGQKGMTFVLESFVNRIGSGIEARFGLNAKGCWILLKGSDAIADPKLSGFASCMATMMRAYLRPSEVYRIIAAHYPQFSRAQGRDVLEAMRSEGLIEEDAVWYSSKSGLRSRVVYRLPYQRFSDHIVARHLLREYLDVTSARTIKQSLANGSPLARVFAPGHRHRQGYSEPGWAQALIAEFPERVGTRLPAKHRELFFVLPPERQHLGAYLEPFVAGIFWRSPSAFTEGTRKILNNYLTTNRGAWERVVDALAAVATKPNHPYHARVLYNFLAKYRMPERDLTWSEYLRRGYASPTIRRLLTWAEKLDHAGMSRESAEELVVLLSLVLTTVVRDDRDLATRALVVLGERFPDVLFGHAVVTLPFDDPYVSERMLAAAYGVTMSLVDSTKAPTFRPMLGQFAKTLYRNMFAPNARYATTHTLKRDYALGIIELANNANCVLLPKSAQRYLSAPFPSAASPFASDGMPDAGVSKIVGDAIGMDFGNYTIGSVIPNRANYDHKNPEYVKVRARIERRMVDLGYDRERFADAEREIGHSVSRLRDEHKVDRYGKKYSWIAFFEMWGEREATKKLPDWRIGERTPDCGVDPSFPRRPPKWTPSLPNLLGDSETSTASWVGGDFTPSWKPLLVVPEINDHEGEWILLDGYVRGVDELVDRELFAFLRGVFVLRQDVRRFRAKFNAIQYPGNDALPDGATENYLFAGEAGRRSNFARHLRMKSGRYRRQLAEAFQRGVATRGRSASTAKFEVREDIESPSNDDTDTIVFEWFGRTPRLRQIPGIRLEVPTIQFAWESYHSTYNAFSNFFLPSPSLIQRFGLSTRNREIDFYDGAGKPATLYRESRTGWRENQHRLLYIRADLLREYLKETRQELVWCNWGERDWGKSAGDTSNAMSGVERGERSKIFQAYRHIHRSVSVWRRP